MNKYQVLDQRATVSISAPVDQAQRFDAALACLRVKYPSASVSNAARCAIVNYVFLMLGVDTEQAAAVLALARWLQWFGQGA